MAEPPRYPPLKPLHPDSSLKAAKLDKYEKLSTEALLDSLLPGSQGCLKHARMELYWMDIIELVFFGSEG